MASLRRERRIQASADVVWRVIRDPRDIVKWFPGVVRADVDGDARTITTATGLTMPERIMARDDTLRHFAYTITSELYQFHLGTIDVLEIGESESLCVYGTTAEPDLLCLVVAGATDAALAEIERLALAASGEAS